MATLQVETPLLSCTKSWCFHFWDNGGIWLQTILQIAPHVLWNQGYTMHKKFHNVLNYTMHTNMWMLEDWQQTKASTVILTTLTIPILETLFPFHFLVLHLCNWLFGLLLWSLHHFVIWIRWQWEPKLSLCPTYSILSIIIWKKWLLNLSQFILGNTSNVQLLISKLPR